MRSKEGVKLKGYDYDTEYGEYFFDANAKEQDYLDGIIAALASTDLKWGTYGKGAMEHCSCTCPEHRLRWVKLVDCETDHLQSILKTHPYLTKRYLIAINSILIKRGVTPERFNGSMGWEPAPVEIVTAEKGEKKWNPVKPESFTSEIKRIFRWPA